MCFNQSSQELKSISVSDSLCEVKLVYIYIMAIDPGLVQKKKTIKKKLLEDASSNLQSGLVTLPAGVSVKTNQLNPDQESHLRLV